MGKENNNITIKDWAGNELYNGSYKSKKVDVVLNANRCKCKQCKEYRKGKGNDYCTDSNHTGYAGDFYIAWDDETRNENIYEYINY